MRRSVAAVLVSAVIVAALTAAAWGGLAIPPKTTPPAKTTTPPVTPPATPPATPPGTTPATPPAESNKGRTGTYQSKTSHEGYNYYVYVPKNYSDDNPAGLHVFFHGQGGGGGAASFGQWAKYFLEAHNLIGINMQYTDGDNGKDTAGKVDAAVEAIKQVSADYKIVFGRGAVGSFSGGGLPHESLFSKFGKHAPGGPAPCPFNHSALYGSNYWGDPTSVAAPMSWFVGVGTKEWGMGAPTLGTSQTARARQLFDAALKGGTADVYFKVTKDKGHSISDDDVRDSAAQFSRSDLAFAPFVYEKDYAEPTLAPIARAANTLALAKAVGMLDRLAADPKADDATKAKAAALRKRIDARIEAVMALAGQLAEDDPALAAYYGGAFTGQLGTHPKAKELKERLAAARKKPTFQPATATCAAFWTNFRNIFQGANVAPGAAKFLEDAKAKSGEKSLVGKMATEILLVP